MHTTADCRVTPTTADTFAERASELVAFMVERSRDAGLSARQREQELAEWIWHSQQAARAAHHFMTVELDIILRALHGPSALARGERADCGQLCRVISSCLSQPTPPTH
jgi:hypothetical protein